MKLRLFNAARSSPSYRIRIALGLKGLPYEYVPVDIFAGAHKQADYLAVNPQGVLPALEADGVVLTQSNAILEWLEEAKPSPPLLPRDPVERARVRAVAALVATDITPLHSMRVSKAIAKDLGQGGDGLRAWTQRWVSEGFAAIEKLLSGEGPFAFGPAPTMADVYIVPAVFVARGADLELARFPRIAALDAAAQSHPAFAAAHPAKQPDFK